MLFTCKKITDIFIDKVGGGSSFDPIWKKKKLCPNIIYDMILIHMKGRRKVPWLEDPWREKINIGTRDINFL